LSDSGSLLEPLEWFLQGISEACAFQRQVRKYKIQHPAFLLRFGTGKHFRAFGQGCNDVAEAGLPSRNPFNASELQLGYSTFNGWSLNIKRNLRGAFVAPPTFNNAHQCITMALSISTRYDRFGIECFPQISAFAIHASTHLTLMSKNMKALYVDNFRGFSKTFIPLERVNFLIGENSTGKSSVLSLIYLVSRNALGITGFQSDEGKVDLGSFEDIVSADSEDKSYFTVGFLTSENRARNKSKVEAENLAEVTTYCNQGGVPRIKKLTYTLGSDIVIARITKKQLSYKIIKEKIAHPISRSDFQTIVEIHEKDDSKFVSAKVPDGIDVSSQDIPPFVLKDIIERHSRKGNLSSAFTFKFSGPLPQTIWIAPIREKPKRTYDLIKAGFSPEGAHTPYRLNDILNGKNKKAGDALKVALRLFGKESGLFSEVKSKRYGKGSSAPFELDVVLTKNPLRITNVGYGISQVLPIIVEAFIKSLHSSFAIQQPEVHLHPRAQAALGDFFFRLAQNEGKTFFLETHSDYLVDRYRKSISTNKKYISSQVLFFTRDASGNKCCSIEIEGTGAYSEKQPPEFREFFLKEQMAMLAI